MRVVLDTNILVRAATHPGGPAGRLLREAATEPHTLITSPSILGEVGCVLAYPRLQARWPLTQEEIQAYVERLAEVAELVSSVVVEPLVDADPDDDPVIQTAVSGSADVLCTRDRHLLDAAVVDYCERRGTRVMDDLALLRLLSSA